MDFLSYSVVIRTLGNAGEKYKRLLDSIYAQTVKPEEIIVVIPTGCSLDYQIGNERVIYCKKGMVTQRAVGIRSAKSEYILIVDDDIEFGERMVEDLFQFLVKNKLDCCLPMEGMLSSREQQTIDFHFPFLKKIRYGLTGQLFFSNKKSDYLDVLTFSAGHKIYVRSNNLDNCYLCTTGCFQCFFIKTDIAKSARFEEEKWLEEGRLTSYASYDEPVFFSKLNRNRFRMAYALRVRYRHLDAKVGHNIRTKLDEKCTRYYSFGRNRLIYWFFFLWKPQKGFFAHLKLLFWGIYAFTNYYVYTMVINLRPNYWQAIKALSLGYWDAFSFIIKHWREHK